MVMLPHGTCTKNVDAPANVVPSLPNDVPRNVLTAPYAASRSQMSSATTWFRAKRNAFVRENVRNKPAHRRADGAS